MQDLVPRRSVLYMPGSNARALEKARSLPADCFIIDLEDAVAPREKERAREQTVAALASGQFRDTGEVQREVAVRINGLDSPWGRDDLAAIASTAATAVAIPKVERAEQVQQVADALASNPAMAIWAMIETPRGVLNAEAIATSHPRINVLVMGTSDLAKDLRVPMVSNRIGLLYSLGYCVLVARAHGLCIIDGVQLDLENDKDLLLACEQARNMGFDGKSLIHPKQIAAANRFFSPTKGAHEHARQVIEAWKQAEKEGSGVVVVNGKLVENLHVDEAKRVLALVKSIESRQA